MELIEIHPEILGGIPVFKNTRVPVRALWDYLEAGDPLDEFLEDFPDVSREHAVAVLEESKSKILTSLECAY
jgi:uncharacterized protein (DUF433 family)